MRCPREFPFIALFWASYATLTRVYCQAQVSLMVPSFSIYSGPLCSAFGFSTQRLVFHRPSTQPPVFCIVVNLHLYSLANGGS